MNGYLLISFLKKDLSIYCWPCWVFVVVPRLLIAVASLAVECGALGHVGFVSCGTWA